MKLFIAYSFFALFNISMLNNTVSAEDEFVIRRSSVPSSEVGARRLAFGARKAAHDNNQKNNLGKKSLLSSSFVWIPFILGILSLFLFTRAVFSLRKIINKRNLYNEIYCSDDNYYKIIKLSQQLSKEGKPLNKNNKQYKKLEGLIESEMEIISESSNLGPQSKRSQFFDISTKLFSLKGRR